MKWILGIATFAFVTPAHAANWVEISRGSSGSVVLVDANSRRIIEGNYQVWVKIDQSKNTKVRARTSKELWRFNCANQTQLIVSWADYGPDGRVMGSNSAIDISYDYKPVIPETTGEDAMKYACAQ